MTGERLNGATVNGATVRGATVRGATVNGNAPAGARIVRLANFVTPTSGGLRTALRELGRGYLAAGHRPVLVVPGAAHRDEETDQGRVVTLPGAVLPGTGGYRVLRHRAELARLLEDLAPDRLEVSDRATLRWTGGWARRHGVPTAMVSHESLDGLLRTWGLPPGTARRLADRHNRRTAQEFERIVCTTDWAAAEFRRIGVPVEQAPLGVDLERCHPGNRSAALRASLAGRDERLVLMCSRLSPEKRPATALAAVAELNRLGVPTRLVVAGDGPLRPRLTARAAAQGLPVRFLGHVADRALLAALLATADAAIAPGPIETFGLAALEALASGTPVAVSPSSALPGVVGSGGAVATADTPAAFAEALCRLFTRTDIRSTARARAQHFSWAAATQAFLRVHGLADVAVGRFDTRRGEAATTTVAAGRDDARAAAADLGDGRAVEPAHGATRTRGW
ncbi:glycosyltransferase [Streptacidiphilus monticola]|uniref:Glycosyltransferase n=1 Tax=Streptacidiphilus monticola TaxID=2161674 RepID=A0ABW1FWS0_9ACTN